MSEKFAVLFFSLSSPKRLCSVLLLSNKPKGKSEISNPTPAVKIEKPIKIASRKTMYENMTVPTMCPNATLKVNSSPLLQKETIMKPLSVKRNKMRKASISLICKVSNSKLQAKKLSKNHLPTNHNLTELHLFKSL